MGKEYEFIHKFRPRHQTHIRVWTKALILSHDVYTAQNLELYNVIHGSWEFEEDLAEEIAALPFVNAVECIIGERAFVIYPEWP